MFFKLSDQNIAEYCSFFQKTLSLSTVQLLTFTILMDMYLAIFANLCLVDARHLH